MNWSEENGEGILAIRKGVGKVVPHKGGSGGVFEFSPNGTPMGLWSYSNAVAYTGATLEILRLLGDDVSDLLGVNS